MFKISSNNFLWICSWLVLILSMLCNYSAFNILTHELLICSDAVSVQFLYDDLIAGSGKLKDWYFPTSPSVFPDLVLFSLVQLFHFKYTVSIMIYAIILVIVISLLGNYIFKKSVPAKIANYGWLIPCLFSIFFIEGFYFSNDILMNHILTTCYYHAGAFVNCLISFAVILNSWSKRDKYIFLFLFSALSVFSDMLYLVLFVIPISITMVFLLKKQNLKFVIISVLLLCLATIISLKFYNYLNENRITYFYKPYKMFEYSNIFPALQMFLTQMKTYILIPGLRSFHILFTFVSIPSIFILLIYKRKSLSSELKYFLLFYFIFSGIVLAAPIINGNYTAFDTLRYNAAVFYFSILILALFLAYLIEYKLKNDKQKRISSLFIPVLFLVLILAKFSPKGLKNYANYYPNMVKGLDSLSLKYGLKHGLAVQAHAKYITAFSKNNLEVLTVHANCCIWELASSINWYYDNDFDFIITHGLQPDIEKTFKVIDTLYTKEFTILRVQKFHYPQGTYCPVTKQ